MCAASDLYWRASPLPTLLLPGTQRRGHCVFRRARSRPARPAGAGAAARRVRCKQILQLAARMRASRSSMASCRHACRTLVLFSARMNWFWNRTTKTAVSPRCILITNGATVCFVSLVLDRFAVTLAAGDTGTAHRLFLAAGEAAGTAADTAARWAASSSPSMPLIGGAAAGTAARWAASSSASTPLMCATDCCVTTSRAWSISIAPLMRAMVCCMTISRACSTSTTPLVYVLARAMPSDVLGVTINGRISDISSATCHALCGRRPDRKISTCDGC